MAIQFARIGHVQRSKGGNACCKGAYNERSVVVDQKTGVSYNFCAKGDNVYHEVLLPEHVDQKFKSTKILMNEVERSEKRKDSVLLKDIVLALPDDKELDLEDRIEITHRLIEKRGWIKEGLGLQMDIHRPHDGEKNWHAHLLVTTRRFTEDGKGLSSKKAVDLEPKILGGKARFVIKEDTQIHEELRDIINDYYKELGIDRQVDAISTVPHEHIGPVRMRSILNSAVERNELRRTAHIENMKDGDSVLDRITRTQSVFSVKDLERAVKDLPDGEIRERLVEEALASGRLVPLYSKEEGVRKDGQEVQETGYFTTREVREEEERVMRILGRIAARANYSRSPGIALAIEAQGDLSEAQKGALKAALLGGGGVRVIKGRAGTGKSRVLGVAARLARGEGQEVLGLAPTNKAAAELRDKGINAYTVKGYLFALKNGRVGLSAGSLVIVDEAGMVANSDLQELAKAINVHKCNLVLAGDERQLTSVERGGLFEVAAREFGSYELGEIRRQSSNWGREMAGCFASGDIAAGIDILKEHGGLSASDTLEHSMSDLIAKWQESPFDLDKRLIITVRNRDVDALNDGIREVLKKSGALSGETITIERRERVGEVYASIKREFMEGERVMFAANNKDLGIHNGEFGKLTEVSKDSFTVVMDGEKERIVKFDPAVIQGLRHGYAVTTYKSQGASILYVYVLHSGVGNSRSSYVNLTRYIEGVKLFYNFENTCSINHLKSQLGVLDEKASSLNFLSFKDIEDAKRELEEQTAFKKIGKWVKEKAVVIGDRLHKDHEYYQFEEQPIARAKVEEALAAVHERLEEQEQIVMSVRIGSTEQHVAVVAGGGSSFRNNDTGGRRTSKQRFYDKVAKAEEEKKEIKARQEFVRDYKGELDELKHELKFKTADIVIKLLGTPNKALSNSNMYRYGNKGSMAVWVHGNKAGTWYDFEAGSGGDMISLYARENGQGFKEAVEYLKDLTGVSKKTTLKLVHDNEVNERYVKISQEALKEQEKAAREAKRIGNLYEVSKPIVSESVAGRYLREERGVRESVGEIKDVKTTGIWDRGTRKRYPAIVAFARDNAGKVTGGQTILLDPETATKADVSIAKKSFGKIGGAFVEIQKHTKESRITFIAEGLETAISIKEADVGGRVLCSLGIGNIKNYEPKVGEKIIICADNDGAASKTEETVDRARNILEDKGAIVYIVKPKEKGDFNDVLKIEGIEGVREYLDPEIKKLKVDNGLTRISEKLAAITGKIREEKPELKEAITGFEKGLELAFKYAPTSCYKVVKAYNDGSFELAQKTTKDITFHGINRTIEQNLEQFGKSVSSEVAKSGSLDFKLVDFKGNSYQDKTEYLASLAQDKEVMGVLGVSNWSGRIHDAVLIKKILAEDARKEFEMTIRLHQEKLNDITKLDPKFDTEKFKEELKDLPDKIREERVKSSWENSFKEHIAPKLDHFDRLKQEAKTVDEYLGLIKKEHHEGVILYKTYKELIHHGSAFLNDSRIESLKFLYEDKPDFTLHLARDVKHGIEHGLWSEKEALERLNTEKSLRFLTGSFFDKCRKYHLDGIYKDLRSLDRGMPVEKDNLHFDNHKAYLEHHVNNEMLKPYLQNTIVTQRLGAIYKHEAHQLQHQKQQELEHLQEKALEKEYDKGGFGL